MVGRLMLLLPPRCPSPVTMSQKPVTMSPYMAKGSLDVIKLRTLQWGDYPGLSGGAN